MIVTNTVKSIEHMHLISKNLRVTPRECDIDPIQAMHIDQRVVENVSKVLQEFSEKDQLAAKHLFSELRHLEEIATLAAIRGDGIAGQLEDEFVHRESFETLAVYYGGLQPPSPEITALLNFLKAQEGDMSLALLNVVGESWLETVFHHIGSWGVFDELFDSIEEDEARHVHDALELAKPDPEDCLPMVRKLESMLERIMLAPEFILPLLHFGGPVRTANIGLAICDAHEKACDHLGVEPQTHRMRTLCRGQRLIASNAPEPVEMTNWDKTKQVLWKHPAPQQAWIEVPVETTSPVKLQARVVGMIGRALARNPKLKQVWRDDQLYETKEIIVGQRFLNDGEQVSTVFIHGAEHLDNREIIHQTNRKIKRIQSKPYPEPLRELGEIERLLPPSRCPVVVNYYPFGNCPFGPMSNIEGVPIIVMIGTPYRKDQGWATTITVSIDHRVGDAKDGGYLMVAIKDEFEYPALYIQVTR